MWVGQILWGKAGPRNPNLRELAHVLRPLTPDSRRQGAALKARRIVRTTEVTVETEETLAVRQSVIPGGVASPFSRSEAASGNETDAAAGERLGLPVPSCEAPPAPQTPRGACDNSASERTEK